MPTKPALDNLILGGGIAGSILADQLIEQGETVLLVDDPSRSSCSRVAAGLINPIGGKRLKRVWGLDFFFPDALAYYRGIEQRFSKQVFYPRELHRHFADESERELWIRKRARDPHYQEIVSPLPENSPWRKSDHPTFESGFSIKGSGYLDTEALIETLHAHLQKNGALLCAHFHYDEVSIAEAQVDFREFKARRVIFAEGHLATQNPFFKSIPYKPAKGVIASIVFPPSSPWAPLLAQPDTPALLKQKFIIPRHDGTASVGATYNWADASDTPDRDGIEELSHFLDRELGEKTWEYQSIKAGVRPATAGAYPAVGPHPNLPNVYSFNGFGSKGSLQVPHLANALAKQLSGKKDTFPPDVLPSRFFKTTKPQKQWRATDVAKERVKSRIRIGDAVIDATAGNGHDSLWLAQSVGRSGSVHVFDIQSSAIEATTLRLAEADLIDQVNLHLIGHEHLALTIPPSQHGKIAAIVFNLGYLPGSDQTTITRPNTTLAALKSSLKLLKEDGILSVTLYPAHPGGQEEVDAVLSWHRSLPSDEFCTSTEAHPAGRADAPFPIFVIKKAKP